jgi:hypothetical protein
MPIMLMLISQIALAATNIISKLAINDGMSMRVATAYRFIFASAFTIPVALIFDRYVSTFILFYTFIFACFVDVFSCYAEKKDQRLLGRCYIWDFYLDCLGMLTVL